MALIWFKCYHKLIAHNYKNFSVKLMKRLIRVRSLHPRLYCKSQSTRDVVIQMYKNVFTLA